MSATTVERTNSETVRDFIAAFWDGEGADAADRFLTVDYVDHAYTPHNGEGLKQQFRELVATFSDRRTTIEDVVAAGDKVVVRLTLRATQTGAFRGTPPTGNPIEVSVYRTYRLVEGKIAEHWALLDTATLLRQIGTQPTPENACKR